MLSCSPLSVEPAGPDGGAPGQACWRGLTWATLLPLRQDAVCLCDQSAEGAHGSMWEDGPTCHRVGPAEESSQTRGGQEVPSKAVSLPRTPAPQAPTPVKQGHGDVVPAQKAPFFMGLLAVEQGLPSLVFLPAPWSLCLCVCTHGMRHVLVSVFEKQGIKER